MMKTLVAKLAVTGLLGAAAWAEEAETAPDHPYVGLWVTKDGHIRHELLPNGPSPFLN